MLATVLRTCFWGWFRNGHNRPRQGMKPSRKSLPRLVIGAKLTSGKRARYQPLEGIRRKFGPGWLLLEHVRLDRRMRPKGGRLLHHGLTRDEVFQLACAIIPKRAAIVQLDDVGESQHEFLFFPTRLRPFELQQGKQEIRGSSTP